MSLEKMKISHDWSHVVSEKLMINSLSSTVLAENRPLRIEAAMREMSQREGQRHGLGEVLSYRPLGPGGRGHMSPQRVVRSPKVGKKRYVADIA